MPKVLAGVCAAACALLLSSPGATQDRAAAPPRMPQSGRVLDAAGQPVAGARVTLVSQVAARDGATADLVQVEADGEGRFRAQLDPARAYSAWAAATQAGTTRVTPPLDVGPARIDLRFAADEAPAPTQFQVTGAEAWREHGPLRLELRLLACDALTVRGELAADGSLVLPPLPELQAEVRLFVGDRFVYGRSASLRRPLALPAPQRIPLRVVDAQQQPVAGATVYRLYHDRVSSQGPFPDDLRGEQLPVATTDAAGTASVLVAADKEPFASPSHELLLFVATGAERVSALSGFANGPLVDGKHVPDAASLQGTLPFTLQAPARRVIPVRAPADRTPATLTVRGNLRIPYGDNSYTTFPMGWVQAVVDGALRPPPLLDGNETWAVEVPGVLPPLADDDPFRRVARPTTMVLHGSVLAAEAGLDLRPLQALRVQVLDPSAGPAIGARVLCLPAGDNGYVPPNAAMQARADRSGRLVLPVLPGRHLLLALLDDSCVHAVIEVAPGLPAQSLQLQPLPRMRVRVLDEEGKPKAGVRFRSSGASWGGGGTPEDLALLHFARHLSQWTLRQPITDANGHADLPFLPRPNLRTRVDLTWNGKQTRIGDLEATEERLDFVVQ